MNNVADVIPHSAQAVHHILHSAKDVFMSNVCPQPGLKGHLVIVIDWTPTTRLMPYYFHPGNAHEPKCHLY